VQKDRTILLEAAHHDYGKMRDFLTSFAELEQSLQHLHIYRLTRLSLWNAAAAGLDSTTVLHQLAKHSRYEMPPEVGAWITETMGRYGRLVLQREGEQIVLRGDDPALVARLASSRTLRPLLEGILDELTLRVRPGYRGLLKQRLRQRGYPPTDLAGYHPGAPLAISLRGTTRGGKAFAPRPYQLTAATSFCRNGLHGGSGVIVLPCGAGKTIVGLAVLAQLRSQALILCPHTNALRQWRQELLDKTSLEPHEIGEYSSERKEIAPVTLSTYQILTYRPYVKDPESGQEAPFPHFALFGERDWGLIIYDEVHLLPAPVFRVTAELQARRRLGLTATLVREDGRQGEVFSLIGPRVYEAPWRELERQGWLASARCIEVRVPMSDERRLAYARGRTRHARSRLSAENPAKVSLVRQLAARHRSDRVLVIGRYLRQLRSIAQALEAPRITGKTPVAERERLFQAFRRGDEPLLVVSNVANFALDLPEANVAIQVSGTYGSRQEEAQRLGRLLRPKASREAALFYTLVSQDTIDQEYAARRQRFLIEQGYHYEISAARDLVEAFEEGDTAQPAAAPARELRNVSP
jgi:DNA excision repair protein ERCC-3